MYVINCESKELIRVNNMSELEDLIAAKEDQAENPLEDLFVIDGSEYEIYKLKKVYKLEKA